MNQLTMDEVRLAAQAALALTNPDDDYNRVPMKHAAGAIYLREIMSRVLQNEYEVVPTRRMAPPPPPPESPESPQES